MPVRPLFSLGLASATCLPCCPWQAIATQTVRLRFNLYGSDQGMIDAIYLLRVGPAAGQGGIVLDNSDLDGVSKFFVRQHLHVILQ